MALPIRLFAGASGDIEIPLIAQSIDIAVDRNASHFPLPNMPRLAIDTNTPEIGIEIQGLLQDDEVAFESVANTDTTPILKQNDVIINFASILPTSLQLTNEQVHSGDAHLHMTKATVTLRRSVNPYVGITASSTTVDIHDMEKGSDLSNSVWDNLEATDNSANADTGVDINNPSGYTSGATSIVVDSSSHSIEVGQRLHKSDGTFIGTVSAISGATLSMGTGIVTSLNHNDDVYSYQATLFNRFHQVIGSIIDFVVRKEEDDDGNVTSREFTHITLDRVEVPMVDTERYIMVTTSRPPNEAFLHKTRISFWPNQWRRTAQRVYDSPPKIIVRLDSTQNAWHDFTTDSSGGVDFSVEQTAVNRMQHRNCIVNLPIKGITTKASNGNPAATLALLLERVLEDTNAQVLLSETATNSEGKIFDRITEEGGVKLGDAFSAVVSGPLISVTQKQAPKSLALANNWPPTSQLDYSINWYVVGEVGQSFALVCEHFGTDRGESLAFSNKSRSAGDKVQDLIGLFSNAHKQRDLIRGIQIPYDSLIQSTGITGVARNFFLTFGEQSIDAKGSLGNTVSASEKMVPSLLPYEIGGNPVTEKDSNWAERFGLGELTGVDASLGNFLENLVADTLITLTSNPRGNEGGIRIIPEKLHVRYDAGNNYYAFNMKLLASDYVLGV